MSLPLARSPVGILPIALLAQARRTPEAGFVEAFNGAAFLLFKVTGAESPLAVGLLGAGPSGAEAVPLERSFFTAARSSASFSVRPPQFTPATLRELLKASAHAAVSMQKRADGGKSYSHRLSVGRARNNDVMLQDDSVSKFHAWFEVDEGGGYSLADARSRNSTKVNGRPLDPISTANVSNGDRIVFGSIGAIFCRAETLWQAINGM